MLDTNSLFQTLSCALWGKRNGKILVLSWNQFRLARTIALDIQIYQTPFYQMIVFPLSDKSIPALVEVMSNTVFPGFLPILGFLHGEEWLENLSSKDITGTGTSERLGLAPGTQECSWQPSAAASPGKTICSPWKGVCFPPGALPPHPSSGPSCRVSTSTEGMNLLRLKILCFYLDEKKNLACLHWHTKIGSVWVNLQSFSRWIYI